MQFASLLGPQPLLDRNRLRHLIAGDAVLGGAEEATHQGERVEAVSREHLVIGGRMGDDPLCAYPVELGHRRKVAHHLPFSGGQDPAVPLACERVGLQPAPDGGVPINVIDTGIVRVDEGAQLICAAFELCSVQWPDPYLRCSGRDHPSASGFLLSWHATARRLYGLYGACRVHAWVQKTKCKGAIAQS